MLRLLKSLLVLAFMVLVFRVTLWAIPVTEPPPMWTASSGEPVPEDFQFVMFPASPDTPVFDAPSGRRVNTLNRAVVNSKQEIDEGGWVAVRDPDATRWVELSSLSYEAPSDSRAALFESYSTVYKARDPGEFRLAQFTLSPDPSGGTIASLRLRQGDHWTDCKYLVASGRPRAIEMDKVFGPALALMDLPRFVAAVVAALISPILFSTSVFLVRWWRRRARKARPVAPLS